MWSTVMLYEISDRYYIGFSLFSHLFNQQVGHLAPPGCLLRTMSRVIRKKIGVPALLEPTACWGRLQSSSKYKYDKHLQGLPWGSGVASPKKWPLSWFLQRGCSGEECSRQMEKHMQRLWEPQCIWADETNMAPNDAAESLGPDGSPVLP